MGRLPTVRPPGLLLLFLAASAAAGDGQFNDLGEAQQAVSEARDAVLARLEKEGLPIPEVFLEADGQVRDAARAWQAKRSDDAYAAFEAAYALYPTSVDHAREELAALPAPGKPGGARLGSSAGKAALAALAWLSRHQDPIGCWDCAGFMKHDPADDRCDGGGDTLHDVGVTALATLAFLEATGTPQQPATHRALQWLRAQQDASGLIGPRRARKRAYDHAVATLALARAYALSGDARYEPPLKAAVDYILAARNDGAAWRYEPADGETDTSVTCWCYRALAAAAEAGIALDLAKPAHDVRAWVDSKTGDDGVIGYNFRGGAVARPGDKIRWSPERSRAMTAAGTVLRVLLDGAKADRKRVQASLDRCLELPPLWNPDDGSIDMYYWYYGTLACAADRTRARKWKTPLLKAVLKHQHATGEGARAGSWDPIGVWGSDGGRVYATAILALTLLHAG